MVPAIVRRMAGRSGDYFIAEPTPDLDPGLLAMTASFNRFPPGRAGLHGNDAVGPAASIQINR
jgi:hypothetical protein